MEVGGIVGGVIVVVATATILLLFLLYRSERARHRQTQSERDELLPYRVIPQAQAEAARIQQAALAEAQTARLQAQVQATQIVEAANHRAVAMTSQASRQIMDNETQSVALLEAAHREAAARVEEGRRLENHGTNEAERLINEAKAKAQQLVTDAEATAQMIAGKALKAQGKTEVYTQAARAMRNTIEGYGDQYLVPPQSVLDDLAESFDHKEAGKQLKESRNSTRQRVNEGRAALCDYKEDKRRVTAIRFVVDAFNGKVDSILSKVKHDNVGILEQKIHDAYALVNLNGQAFKNARIREDYLQARLDELLWATRTMELKRQEREEQRRIKEQLREEERARKEYDKAIKDAEKEERMLHKAMQKARAQMAAATDAKRLEYEQQLAELQQKLGEAEAKNQRALSMAQQTRRGHVYIISNIGSFGENIYKIGLTRRLDPMDRVKELGDASVPFSFDVHAMIWAEDAPTLEAELQRHFQDAQVNKVNPRKEFFRIKLQDIREAVHTKGIDVHWTMVAEAQEYRESKAMGQNLPERNGMTKASKVSSVQPMSLGS